MSMVTDEIKMPGVDNFWMWAMDMWGCLKRGRIRYNQNAQCICP